MENEQQPAPEAPKEKPQEEKSALVEKIQALVKREFRIWEHPTFIA